MSIQSQHVKKTNNDRKLQEKQKKDVIPNCPLDKTISYPVPRRASTMVVWAKRLVLLLLMVCAPTMSRRATRLDWSA